MTEDQIKHMANRFLSWSLPADFNPDAGIRFAPIYGPGAAGWPVGTNLLTAAQAEDMVRHMAEGLPTQPEGEGEAEVCPHGICPPWDCCDCHAAAWAALDQPEPETCRSCDSSGRCTYVCEDAQPEGEDALAAAIEEVARDYWNMLREKGGMAPEDACPTGRWDVRDPIAFALASRGLVVHGEGVEHG